jgi:beta-aspartyl-peptidase (threonine type)
MNPCIVVHGGAGGIDDGRVPAARAGCAAAVRAGLEVLAGGGGALDAVQAAVRVLEDDPEFNAGVGSALTRDGTVEVDAGIMDGATLRIGAIGAVEDLRRPIDLAREVLEDGEHVLLVGNAAWAFARERGYTPAPPTALITERALLRLEAERTRRAAAAAAAGPPRLREGGTVGACAIDAAGHVAAATSTGGITYKRRGRVGDTPLPGCGTWADDLGGAASATGHGESIIRVTLTRAVVDRLRAGMRAQDAARAGIEDLTARVRGEGGVICVDARGEIGIAHSTARMPWASASLAAPEPRTGVTAP